jgi:hypothetical protein
MSGSGRSALQPPEGQLPVACTIAVSTGETSQVSLCARRQRCRSIANPSPALANRGRRRRRGGSRTSSSARRRRRDAAASDAAKPGARPPSGRQPRTHHLWRTRACNHRAPAQVIDRGIGPAAVAPGAPMRWPFEMAADHRGGMGLADPALARARGVPTPQWRHRSRSVS